MKKSPRNRENVPGTELPQPHTGTSTLTSHDRDAGESPSGDLENDPAESWSQTYDHPPAELAEALETYLASLERGETPDRAALIAKYPELAAQLEENLEKLKVLHQVTAGILEDARQSTPRLRIDVDHPIELGDFRILREIGRGGMGVVYEAEQISLGRRVALKTLPLSGLVDPKLLARFKNEVSAAALLDYPHIVSVYAVGCDHGVHYYAMQLIEGRSLEEVIDELKGEPAPAKNPPAKAKLPERDAEKETVPVAQLSTQRQHERPEFYRHVARLGIQAADALHYAHAEGVIHRDIKPSNLLLDREGNLHITDFGLARIQTGDHLTITGDIIGTLRYMSPEQLNDDVLPDERTDVYSLGLTLYELTTGHAAFDASGREQLILQVQQGGPSPPSRWDRQIPRDLEKVLLRSIAARRDERYPSARSFRDDLQRFWDHKPVEARRISRLRRGWRWCRRHPSTAALIALVTAILLTLAVGGPLVAWNQASIAERQRHEAYDADMAAAHVHIEYGEIDQAAILLRKYLPDNDGGAADYRSFEWYEMVDRCRRRLEVTEIRFRSPCWGLATSPSGEIAVGTQFSGPAVFDSQTLQRLWPADGDPNLSVVNEGLAFSHDGRFLFSASRVKKLKVWATETGEMVHEEELDGRPSSMAVSADGIVAVGLWGKLNQGFPQSDPAPILRYRFVETGTNEITLDVLPPLHGAVGVAHDLAIAPDGQRLASGSEDRILRVWDLQSGEVQTRFSDFRGPIMTVAFSPDGTLVCGAGGNYEQAWLSGEALVYELASQRRVAAVFPDEVVYSARFVTNDKLVTGGVDRRISVWDIPTGTLREEINAHADSIRCLAVLPDRTRVVSGSEDNTVRIWDLDRRVPPGRIAAVGSLNDVEDLAFSKDGTKLASASADRAIRIWDPHEGTLLQTLEGHRYAACGVDFSPDGTKLASLASVWPIDPENSSELKIWELATGNADTFEIPDMSYARSIAYAPSGEHVTFVGNNRLVLWNIERKQVERELTSRVGFRVVFSRDGSLIGSVAGVWKYPSLEKVFDLGRSYNGYRFAFDIHPTNEYAATSDMQTHDIVLLSLKDGAEIRRLRGHSEVVLHVHFSHDGKRLASASQAGLVILWNLETGNEIVRYRDHQFWVWSAIFSPDDRLLASSQGGRFMPPTIMVRRAVSGAQARRILMGDRE